MYLDSRDIGAIWGMLSTLKFLITVSNFYVGVGSYPQVTLVNLNLATPTNLIQIAPMSRDRYL